MSKYTTEVRYICEALTGNIDSQSGTHISDIITRAAPLIFDFDFPIFDSEYKLPLEIKILRHFYTREISEETLALWKLRLEDKLNIIMPYYNQLYKSALLDFNPLYDIDYTRTYTRDNNGTTEDTSSKETTNNATTKINEGTKVTSKTTNNKTHQENIIHSGGTNVSTLDTLTSQTNTEKNDTVNRGEKTTQNIDGSTTAKTDNSENGTKSSWGWNLYSDTPQGGVDGFGAGSDGSNTGDFDTQYLTNATKTNGADTTNNKGTANSNTTNTQDLTEQKTINGKNTTKDLTLTTERKNIDEQSKVNENTNITVTDTENDSTSSEQTHNSTSNNEATVNESGNNKNVTQNLEEYTEKVQGKQGGGNYADMLLKFRETFLNIDKMILNELQPLFFGLW